MCKPILFAFLAPFLWLALLPGRSLMAQAFVPDTASIQRFGPGHRHPQAGWIVLHIEGSPSERGVQHGRLMAADIVAYLKCLAATAAPKVVDPSAVMSGNSKIRKLMNTPNASRERMKPMVKAPISRLILGSFRGNLGYGSHP